MDLCPEDKGESMAQSMFTALVRRVLTREPCEHSRSCRKHAPVGRGTPRYACSRTRSFHCYYIDAILQRSGGHSLRWPVWTRRSRRSRLAHSPKLFRTGMTSCLGSRSRTTCSLSNGRRCPVHRKLIVSAFNKRQRFRRIRDGALLRSCHTDL